MREILIGKEGSQPFAISDPKVSRRHAILRIDPTNRKIDIIDNNSTNGTYIYNGSIFVKLFPNHPYQVTPDTMIQLGPDTRFHVRRVLPQPGDNVINGDKKIEKSKNRNSRKKSTSNSCVASQTTTPRPKWTSSQKPVQSTV